MFVHEAQLSGVSTFQVGDSRNNGRLCNCNVGVESRDAHYMTGCDGSEVIVKNDGLKKRLR